jgi:xanthine dehydrogenase YagS FAD-binding subunit
MVPFSYRRALNIEAAVATGARHRSDEANVPGVDFLAGGTDMMQLMRERVRNPGHIVDINTLPNLAQIESGPNGLHLGALARMSDTAAHPSVREHFPVIAEALLASASPQVRNLASLGGNLLQRTRCGYFRDVVTPCNKREPGSGCPALIGQNRLHAILGTSEHCIATYAGDFANALLVLDAQIRISGPHGARIVPLEQRHRLPGNRPHIETQLEPGELITGIDVPGSAAARHSHYLKIRDRATFEWSIASAAIALELDSFGIVRDVRIAVGGVATIPWRLPKAEAALKEKKLDLASCEHAGSFAAEGAFIRGQNAYRKLLIQRTVTRALVETGGLA